METNKIIQAILRGDKASERKLFDAYANKVYGICRRYSVDDHQAKDFLQECFIKLFDKLHKFDAEKGVFDAWMSRVCTNEVLGILRKGKKHKINLVGDDIPEQVLEVEDFDQISNVELVEAIQKLPPGYKDVLNLFVFEKWSHKDIAHMLNINEASSRSQYARAKKLLKKILIQTIPDIYERKLV